MGPIAQGDWKRGCSGTQLLFANGNRPRPASSLFFCYTSGEKSTCKKGTRTIANGHAFQNGPRPLCFSPLFFSFAAWQPWLSRFSWAILPLEAQCRQWPGASRGGNFQQGRGLTMPLPATTNDQSPPTANEVPMARILIVEDSITHSNSRQ